MRRFTLFAALIVSLGLLAAACGGGGGDDGDDGDDDSWPRVIEASDEDVLLIPINSQLVVGDTRFLLGLQDSEGALILNANVTIRFFKIEEEEGILKGETQAQFTSLQQNFVHAHEDNSNHTHDGPEVGAYVAQVAFDEPGDWGAEVDADIEGEAFSGLRVRFNVLEEGTVPAIGDLAPRSEQLTLRDVDDISEIDTANPPRSELHDMTVAEALDTGKPVVVAFTTPAFCTSQLCGPVLDEVVIPLFEQYGDSVVFVHIEPFPVDEARAGNLTLVDAAVEWGLQTEPWVFVVDNEGLVAGKFEGITSAEEVGATLSSLLDAS